MGWTKFKKGSRVRVPTGTKSAYLSRGGPVHPRGGGYVPGALETRAAGPNYRDKRAKKSSKPRVMSDADAHMLGGDTVDHQATLNPQLSTLNPQPSNFNFQT